MDGGGGGLANDGGQIADVGLGHGLHAAKVGHEVLGLFLVQPGDGQEGGHNGSQGTFPAAAASSGSGLAKLVRIVLLLPSRGDELGQQLGQVLVQIVRYWNES